MEFRQLVRWARGEEAGPKMWLPPPLLTLGLETLDLVPQGAVLALVGRPYLLLRYLLELLDLGFHHDHAERLQLRLGLGEIIDRLGRLADFLLRGTRQIDDQLLLIGVEPVPDVEVHHSVGRAVIVIGERS